MVKGLPRLCGATRSAKLLAGNRAIPVTRFVYNLHRAFAGVCLAAGVFLAANYYLDLGLLGKQAKLGLALYIGVAVIYGGLFSPTRDEMRKQREAKRARTNR